jgi:hypothetical protein
MRGEVHDRGTDTRRAISARKNDQRPFKTDFPRSFQHPRRGFADRENADPPRTMDRTIDRGLAESARDCRSRVHSI